MNYKNYEGFTKTYIVVCVTGNGVMEDNFIDHDIVFESNDKGEADSKANELTLKNNSFAEIQSTWYSHRYQVNINTLSDGGKLLYKKFEQEFKKRNREFKKQQKLNLEKFTTIKCNGVIFNFTKILGW